MIYNPITDLLLQKRGIDVSKYEETFLNKAILKRISETECSSPNEYSIFMEQNNGEVDNLINSLHNSYSEFFRNPLTFSVLERILLPLLIQKKKDLKNKEIRIWSAACAAGQEVYSLAMLLEELKNGDSERVTYRIFATDQRESQIDAARKGEYTADAITNLSLKRVNQWFTKVGDIYMVKPELKQNIDFSVFDLLSEQLCCPPESIFGDFDLVVCANLLFYYQPEYRKRILEKIGNCLTLGGSLITGETERDILMSNYFIEVFPQSAIFKRR